MRLLHKKDISRCSAMTMSTISSPKDEPFSLQPVNVQSNKEQLTPHKLSLLVLISEYHEAQKFTPGIDEEGSSNLCKFSEREKRQVMTTLLDLLQVGLKSPSSHRIFTPANISTQFLLQSVCVCVCVCVCHVCFHYNYNNTFKCKLFW